MKTLFHSKDEIEHAALRLHCVPTDNRDALISLGFEPMYPQIASGYDSHLWGRVVDTESSAGISNHRKLVVQRAYLSSDAERIS